MVEIKWVTATATDIKKDIEAQINDLSWVIPSWMQYINIGLYDDEADGITASMRTEAAYRFCTLQLRNTFLTRPKHEQQNTLLHELLHCYCAQLADYAGNTIDKLCPEDAQPILNQTMHEQLTAVHESVVTDLAKVIQDKVYGK